LHVDIATSTDSDGWLVVEVQAEYPFRTVVDWPGLPHETTMRRRLVIRQFR
jgi:hypothetical protein